jgi:hypothetical protein
MEKIDLIILFLFINLLKFNNNNNNNNNKNYIDKETQTERDYKEDKNLETELTSFEIEGLLQYKEDINSINLNRYKWKFLDIIY